MTTLTPPRPVVQRPRAGEDFLARLGREALDHPALHHPWLDDFGNGRFPDMAWAVRDFAWHYHGYSSWFPHYLRAVIERLPRKDHRALLQVNLDEENGELGDEERDTLRSLGIDPSDVDGVPHPVLFRRFCTAIGISEESLAAPSRATRRWRRRFLEFLAGCSPAASVGALGLGTESVVKPLYERIMPAIRGLGLERRDYVFFELHCVVDDQHQEDLLKVARDLGSSPAGQQELRRGMTTALDLRCELWDRLYARAVGQQQAVAS